MKATRIISGILAVLLLAAAFAGAGAAFTYSSSDAVITPSTALTAGQTVTATMKITVSTKAFDGIENIGFTTPLTDETWSTDIYKGGTLFVNDYGLSFIDGFMFNGNSDLTFHITLSGKVSEKSKGKEISVMTITEKSTNTQGYSTYSTKKQMVYDPNNFANDLVNLEKSISSLKTRVATYTGYGIDTAAVNETIKQAESSYSAAKSAGTGNAITAYEKIETAYTYLDKGERALALAALTAANGKLSEIKTITSTLYERGWNSEAQFLDTKSVSLGYTYDTLAKTYNDGGTPDAAKLDAFMSDLYNTVNQANKYLEDSKMPVFVKFLPFIIGGVVAAGAVAGIVVFIIRRRRANSWDELG